MFLGPPRQDVSKALTVLIMKKRHLWLVLVVSVGCTSPGCKKNSSNGGVTVKPTNELAPALPVKWSEVLPLHQPLGTPDEELSKPRAEMFVPVGALGGEPSEMRTPVSCLEARQLRSSGLVPQNDLDEAQYDYAMAVCSAIEVLAGSTAASKSWVREGLPWSEETLSLLPAQLFTDIGPSERALAESAASRGQKLAALMKGASFQRKDRRRAGPLMEYRSDEANAIVAIEEAAWADADKDGVDDLFLIVENFDAEMRHHQRTRLFVVSRAGPSEALKLVKN